MGLPYDENCIILTSTVLTDSPCDGQTDGQTDRRKAKGGAKGPVSFAGERNVTV